MTPTEGPTVLDLTPATDATARIVRTITDDQLDAATPCSGLTVADLLEHLGGLSQAFAMAARKEPGVGGTSASFDGSRLPSDWRESIPAALDDLASAWQDDAAWDGMTAAGGIDMPGEIGGLVALDEVVVHGWDLARAAGQHYAVDTALLEPLVELVQQFGGDDSGPDGAFGRPVPVPDDAPLLDRIVGLTGRDPSWVPPAG
jgi:uncharacterized protein (TIGR03086 family)